MADRKHVLPVSAARELTRLIFIPYRTPAEEKRLQDLRRLEDEIRRKSNFDAKEHPLVISESKTEEVLSDGESRAESITNLTDVDHEQMRGRRIQLTERMSLGQPPAFGDVVDVLDAPIEMTDLPIGFKASDPNTIYREKRSITTRAMHGRSPWLVKIPDKAAVDPAIRKAWLLGLYVVDANLLSQDQAREAKGILENTTRTLLYYYTVYGPLWNIDMFSAQAFYLWGQRALIEGVNGQTIEDKTFRALFDLSYVYFSSPFMARYVYNYMWRYLLQLRHIIPFLYDRKRIPEDKYLDARKWPVWNNSLWFHSTIYTNIRPAKTYHQFPFPDTRVKRAAIKRAWLEAWKDISDEEWLSSHHPARTKYRAWIDEKKGEVRNERMEDTRTIAKRRLLETLPQIKEGEISRHDLGLLPINLYHTLIVAPPPPPAAPPTETEPENPRTPDAPEEVAPDLLAFEKQAEATHPQTIVSATGPILPDYPNDWLLDIEVPYYNQWPPPPPPVDTKESDINAVAHQFAGVRFLHHSHVLTFQKFSETKKKSLLIHDMARWLNPPLSQRIFDILRVPALAATDSTIWLMSSIANDEAARSGYVQAVRNLDIQVTQFEREWRRRREEKEGKEENEEEDEVQIVDTKSIASTPEKKSKKRKTPPTSQATTAWLETLPPYLPDAGILIDGGGGGGDGGGSGGGDGDGGGDGGGPPVPGPPPTPPPPPPPEPPGVPPAIPVIPPDPNCQPYLNVIRWWANSNDPRIVGIQQALQQMEQ